MKLARVCVLALTALTVALPAARAETLADALRDAYHNSGLLDQNRAVLRAADEGVAQSMAALRPVITWQAEANTARTSRSPATFSDNFGSSLGVSMQLLLHDGGASALATEAQKETVLQTRQGLVGVEQRVLLRAIEAYMNVRRTSEFLALRRSNVGVIEQELRAAEDRFDVGEVTRTDVSLAQARLAGARSLLSAAQGDLARAVEEFRAAVGRAPGQLNVVNPAPLRYGLEQARSFALRNHPDILAVQHSVSASELNIRRAEAALNPRLTVGGIVSIDQDLESATGLSLNYGGTLYAGGQLQSLIRQAQANRDAARSGLLITTQGVSQSVGNAYSFLAAAQAVRTASEQQIRAARTAFRGVREEATLGARTTLDVLNAEQELLDAQANLISAQADEVIASYGVLAALGLLTAQHLNLDVQIYDPAAYYNLVKDAPTTYSQQGQALDRVLEAIGE